MAAGMTNKIRLFQNLLKFYETIGLDINPTQSLRSKFLPTAESLFHLIPCAQLFISSAAFFLFKAKSVEEYGISFYVSITTLVLSICILNIACKVDKIPMLIGNYEELIEKR